MTYILMLLGIGTIHLLAAMSPGPAFVTVTRVSVSGSRGSALTAGLGVASASLLWAIAASLGMQILLSHAAWLDDVLTVVGGAYLV